jgi:hypothetical protein
MAGRDGGRTDTDFGQRRLEKTYIRKSMCFRQENFLFLEIFFNNIAESDLKGQPVCMFFVSFMASCF